jgi:hypothetical protein
MLTLQNSLFCTRQLTNAECAGGAPIGGSGAWLLSGWLTQCEGVSGRASASFKSWDLGLHRAS